MRLLCVPDCDSSTVFLPACGEALSPHRDTIADFLQTVCRARPWVTAAAPRGPLDRHPVSHCDQRWTAEEEGFVRPVTLAGRLMVG